MAVIYDNLWNLIAKKGMTRSQLREAAGISTNAMVKLGKNESVQIEVLSKICGVLNCTFDDVVENTGDDALICHLPKIHFNHFNYGVDEQFNTLGLETLEDFPHPHTVKSFSKTLTRYFRECKLGLDACEEFITALSDTGIEVHLLPDVIPEEKYFPQYIPSEDEDNTDESRYKLEWQQATNYVNWHLHKYSQSKQMIDAVLLKASKMFSTEKTELLECGIISADINKKGIIYNAIEQKYVTKSELYPINLLCSIFGTRSWCYLLHQFSDICVQVEATLETLHPSEQLILKLIYQYSLNEKEIVTLLGMPDYECLKEVIRTRYHNKALRKMRHPSRCRKLRYELTSPYHANRNLQTIYQDWVSSIVTNVKESISAGNTLVESLAPFYDENTIRIVDNKAMKWRGIPEVSIDQMGLSWKLRLVLKQANLTSLSDLWHAHGLEIPLNDISSSGLNKLPLDTSQVEELLFELGDHELLPIVSDSIGEIVDLAESIMNEGAEFPSLACNAVFAKVFKHLLRLKYRTITNLISDYKSGELKNRIDTCYSSRNEAGITAIQCILSKTTQRLLEGTYETILYLSGDFWTTLLQDNSAMSLADIRQAYMHDESLNCNSGELEVRVCDLYPGVQPTFEALHKIRSESCTWSKWQIKMSHPEVLSKILSVTGSDMLLEAYVSDYYMDDYKLLIAELKAGEESFVCMFELAANGDLSLINNDTPEFNCLWDAVKFTAQFTEPKQSLNITDPCNLPIEALQLSTRAYNILNFSHIKTVGEIASKSFEELIQLKKMGKKSLIEIVGKIYEVGAPVADELMDIIKEFETTK